MKPLNKIRDIPDALCRFNLILSRSTYYHNADPQMTWQCPTEMLDPALVEQVMSRHGLDMLRVVANENPACFLSVWGIADLILDGQRGINLPPDLIDSEHRYGRPLGFTIQTAYDYHCFYAQRAKETVLRERQEQTARSARLGEAAESAAEAVVVPESRSGDQLIHPLITPECRARLGKQIEADRNCEHRQRTAVLRRLLEHPDRTLRLAGRSDLTALDRLEIDFPHFSAVLEAIRLQLRLQKATRAPVLLRPLLMVGPPGIGKTAFMRRLGDALRLVLLPVSVASSTASWILRGNSSSWKNGSTGVVAKAVLELQPRQGLLLMLDEIDKLQEGSRNFPIEPALLELLEPEQNRHFEDEFLGVPMNLQPLLSVMATANQLGPISAPLKSRLTVVEVGYPTRTQMPAVLRSVDRELREEQPGLRKLFRPLSDEVIAELGTGSLREARGNLLRAYGKALERTTRGKRDLAPEDVLATRSNSRVSDVSLAPTPAPTAEDILAWLLQRYLPPTGGAPPGTVLH